MYTWNDKKRNRVAHLINSSTSKTYCKYENNTHAGSLDTVSSTLPEQKRICSVCDFLYMRKKKGKESPFQGRKLKRRFYSSREWHKLRYEALLKYGAKCMCCGSTSVIHVDHIKPISMYPELATDINNLQILCAVCNSGKGAWDQTDWRKR